MHEDPETDPAVHFGAVYFRKTNPPRADWARDYRVAAADGHTLFRHWAPWGAVEVAPGVYDWEDYDVQLDLAQDNNLKTVIAELITDVPEWLYHRFPHARRETIDGTRRTSEMHISCVTGGHHAMCLDNPEVSEPAGRFLRELGNRYRDHPALFGYDIWNECSHYHPELICYCPATQSRFRRWLQEKYGSLATLARAWLRYSFTAWDEVELPRSIGPYPDVLDAIEFQNDNAFHWMKWRTDALHAADPVHPVTAHGNARSFRDIAPACGDDWRAAEAVDMFGYTYWYGNDCHPLLAGDMIRSAAKGKRFWRAEAIGNSDWQRRRDSQPPALKQDAMSDPRNIRLDILISLASGARGFLNPRWRPLQDGPLFGAFGWYGMDGRRTPRSEMVASIARWAHTPETAPLWNSRPARGEAAILLLEEAQAWCYASYGDTDYYSLSLQGAYEAFLHENIQCDLIKIDQIDDYSLVYVVFPVALKDSTVATLLEWVDRGGCVVGEAAFGYFTDHAHAIGSQPNRGLERLFGCHERDVSFGADRWNALQLRVPDGNLPGALIRQCYEPADGTAVGWFEDGEVAIVDHEYGKGRARLVGSMVGYAYKLRPSAAAESWFSSLLSLNQSTARLTVDKPDIIARLSDSENDLFLWVINSATAPQRVTVSINDGAALIEDVKALRGSVLLQPSRDTIVVEVSGRDASIIQLR